MFSADAVKGVGRLERCDCETECPEADPALRMLALNSCDQSCVTLMRLGTIALMTTLKLGKDSRKR